MRTAGDETPTIRDVRVADERIWAVDVVWGQGPRSGDRDIVNLSPLIESEKAYARLRNKPERFWDVSVVDGGKAISWFNASIDMSAAQIEELRYQERKRADQAVLGDNAAAPVIFSVTPATGASGTVVTITGLNFTYVNQVIFDNIEVIVASPAGIATAPFPGGFVLTTDIGSIPLTDDTGTQVLVSDLYRVSKSAVFAIVSDSKIIATVP